MTERNHKLDRLKTRHRSPMDQFQSFMVYSLLILLVIIFHYALGFLGRRRRRNLPPGPIGLPLLGNLLDVGQRPHESLANLSKKYGPLMTVRLGAITAVVASSSDMAREILQKNDEAFSGRVVPHAATAMSNYDHALVWISAGHEWWRMIRRVLNTHLMHPLKLEELVAHRHKAVREMVARVMEASEMGEAVGVGALAFTTALNQMSNVCFSVNVADYKSHQVEGFRQAVKTVMEVDGRFNIADAFPWLKPLDPQGLRRRAKVAYDWLEAVSDGFVAERLREREPKLLQPAQKDLLDSLLEYGQEEPKFGTTHAKILLVDLILGGTETTSITTEWVIAELMAHPNIMAKARQEITEKVGAIGIIEESKILELPYLQAVVKETMRLHLAVPLLVPHKTEKKVEVNGYVIPKNTQTLVNAWAIARDPDHWENPTSFVPERFLGSEVDFKGQHFAFLPFGSGRRMCPGIPLAQRMVTLMVASLVYHFDWKLPNGLAPEDLDMTDVFGLTLQKATPLLAVPTLINPPKMKHY